MIISTSELRELQTIIREDYGEQLALNQTENIGQKLIILFSHLFNNSREERLEKKSN